MKVKIFDYEDEIDLEDDINEFIESNNIEVIDIKYQVSASVFSEEQIFCFSAMIIYTEVWYNSYSGGVYEGCNYEEEYFC